MRLIRLPLAAGCLAATLLCSCQSPRPPAAPWNALPERPASEPQSSWRELPGWNEDAADEALAAFVRGCTQIEAAELWAESCRQAYLVGPKDPIGARLFFESQFTPWRMEPEEGRSGKLTGYYTPVLRGHSRPEPPYTTPLYRKPDDLVILDADGRLTSDKKSPHRGRKTALGTNSSYWSRAEIDGKKHPLRGQELLWVDDPIDAYFLQVQGSGWVEMLDGKRWLVSFADHNGLPFASLAEGAKKAGVPAASRSIPGLRAWAKSHPRQVRTLLDSNPRYVFFRASQPTADTPSGALGVPLTPGRSLAVDPRHIPLGAPVYVQATGSATVADIAHLAVAQDTGGAILGPARADFYWGLGEAAGAQATRTPPQATFWVLWPNR